MNDFSQLFHAISDDKRQQILAHLEERPRCVSEIVDLFQLSQSAVSKHLGVLKNAGLVEGNRSGQNVIYSLNHETLKCCCREFFERFQCCNKMFSGKRSETL